MVNINVNQNEILVNFDTGRRRDYATKQIDGICTCITNGMSLAGEPDDVAEIGPGFCRIQTGRLTTDYGRFLVKTFWENVHWLQKFTKSISVNE